LSHPARSWIDQWFLQPRCGPARRVPARHGLHHRQERALPRRSPGHLRDQVFLRLVLRRLRLSHRRRMRLPRFRFGLETERLRGCELSGRCGLRTGRLLFPERLWRHGHVRVSYDERHLHRRRRMPRERDLQLSTADLGLGMQQNVPFGALIRSTEATR
jgi:hypothetical protein